MATAIVEQGRMPTVEILAPERAKEIYVLSINIRGSVRLRRSRAYECVIRRNTTARNGLPFGGVHASKETLHVVV